MEKVEDRNLSQPLSFSSSVQVDCVILSHAPISWEKKGRRRKLESTNLTWPNQDVVKTNDARKIEKEKSA